MEKELEPVKEKLQSDRRSTEKYDEKVEEWKVSEPKTHVYFFILEVSGANHGNGLIFSLL